MTTATKPFLALKANDLMSRELVLVPEEMSLRAAAHLLSQHHISGAPVVDRTGRCVGVLSATDFVQWAEKKEHDRPIHETQPCYKAWQVGEFDGTPTEQAAAYMTRDPVTVEPTTPLSTLARLMLDAHIHRLVVVDREGRPIGIVSATDILAAVAYADHGS